MFCLCASEPNVRHGLARILAQSAWPPVAAERRGRKGPAVRKVGMGRMSGRGGLGWVRCQREKEVVSVRNREKEEGSMKQDAKEVARPSKRKALAALVAIALVGGAFSVAVAGCGNASQPAANDKPDAEEQQKPGAHRQAARPKAAGSQGQKAPRASRLPFLLYRLVSTALSHCEDLRLVFAFFRKEGAARFSTGLCFAQPRFPKPPTEVRRY